MAEQILNKQPFSGLCDDCQTSFSSMQTLRVHLRKFHPHKVKENGTLVCAICNGKYRLMRDLLKHYSNSHDIQLKYEERTFYCDEDLEIWKREEEKKTKSSFVKNGGTRTEGDIRTSYFVCHRSGTATLKSDRKRHVKIGGSVKCGKICPAFMKSVREQIEEAIEIKVEYQSVHIGHEMQVGKLRLHKEDKRSLASLLEMGVPSHKIIEDIQKTVSITERLGLTTKRDIQNIRNSFNIDNTCVLHKDDALSVDMRVKEMEKGSFNPILVYKPLGTTLTGNPHVKENDFILSIMLESQLKLLQMYGNKMILIDATHGTNQYGFLLTTIMVSDETHEGLPVAICYSNRVCSDVMEQFFIAVKSRLPSLAPRVFMSDDDPAFSNAWKKVFGPVQFELLCKWHLSRSWNRNLNIKLKNQEMRNKVYAELKNMTVELDRVTFDSLYEKFLDDYTRNEETKPFIKYFVQTYGGRQEKWAYCHRVGCGVNTNTKVERWHKAVKYESSGGGGKVMRRLDKSLDIVLGAISQKFINRLVSIERGKLTTKVTEIRKRHATSINQAKDYAIYEMQLDKYIVSKNVENEIITYEIKKGIDCDCELKCEKCKICIHSFSCTCQDYSIRFVICKHIHMVCQKFPSLITSATNDDDNMLIIDEDSNFVRRQKEKEAIQKETEKAVACKSREVLLQTIKEHMGNIFNNIALENDEQISRCEKRLRSVMNEFKPSRSGLSLPIPQKCPSNKSVTPQRRNEEAKPSKKQKLVHNIIPK